MVTRISNGRSPRRITALAAPAVRRSRKVAGQAARSVRDNVSSAVGGTLGLRGERMSKVDTAWLRMDCEANLMMIVGVWVLKPGIHLAELRQRISETLLMYPRFCQRVEQDATGATWVHDEDFDIDRHVVTEKLARKPRGREQEALQERLGELAMTPLDMAHPLVAISPGRGLPGWFGHDGAYPPLHCRRHCADLGDAVDGRRRRRAAAAQAS